MLIGQSLEVPFDASTEFQQPTAVVLPFTSSLVEWLQSLPDPKHPG